MSKKSRFGVYPFIRSLHLYIALFLAPWLLMYATSAFFLNHNDWFRELFNVVPPGWAIVHEQNIKSLNPLPSKLEQEPSQPEQDAKQLLTLLDIDGEYQLLAGSNKNQLVILRYSGAGNYRVTWLRASGDVIVERYVPASLYGFLHALHFKSGYGWKTTAPTIWAVIVDFVAISIWLWVLTGLYLWLRRKSQRFGMLVFSLGITSFIVLATLLYH